MTFSLRPRSSSVLPEMAASVSTRVVSWNDAAEMKLSVDNEAFVMPSSTGFAVAGRLSCPHAFALVDADVLAVRDQVLVRLAIVGADDDLTHAFHEAVHLDAAVDLGDDCLLLRLARLEQFRHARQAAGDVLGLRRL